MATRGRGGPSLQETHMRSRPPRPPLARPSPVRRPPVGGRLAGGRGGAGWGAVFPGRGGRLGSFPPLGLWRDEARPEAILTRPREAPRSVLGGNPGAGAARRWAELPE